MFTFRSHGYLARMTNYYALAFAAPPDGEQEIAVVPQPTDHDDPQAVLEHYQNLFSGPGEIHLELADGRIETVPETATRRRPLEVRKICGHAAPRELNREGEHGRVRCQLDPDHVPELLHRPSSEDPAEGGVFRDERAWEDDGTVVQGA